MSSQFSWLGFFTDAGIPLREAEKYSLQFDDNRMKPDMLPDLTKELLNDLGISLIGDILAILRHSRQVQKQLERSKTSVIASSRAADPAQRTGSSAISTQSTVMLGDDSHKAKRRPKSTKSKATAVQPAIVESSTVLSSSQMPAIPSSNNSNVSMVGLDEVMEDQPRRIVTRPASAPVAAYHTDAMVSNEAQTTVIRRAEQPQSALNRLGNGVASTSGSSGASSVGSSMDGISQLRNLVSSQKSSDRGGRRVEAVSKDAPLVPNTAENVQAVRQTVSVRLPSDTPPLARNSATSTRPTFAIRTAGGRSTTATVARDDSYDDDDSDTDGAGDGDSLRRIVQSVSSTVDPSYQRPVQTVTLSGRQVEAVPTSSTTAVRQQPGSATVRMQSVVKPTITRVIPLSVTRGESTRSSSSSSTSSRQQLSSAAISTLHSSSSRRVDSEEEDFDDDDDDPEFDDRHVAVSHSRKSQASGIGPSSRQTSASPAALSSHSSTSRAQRPARQTVKARLGSIPVSEESPSSSRTNSRQRESRKPRSSVFNRLGETA
eukprot:scpid62655/ scgid3874/ Uncharacterized protein C19orf47 homolog